MNASNWLEQRLPSHRTDGRRGQASTFGLACAQPTGVNSWNKVRGFATKGRICGLCEGDGRQGRHTCSQLYSNIYMAWLVYTKVNSTDRPLIKIYSVFHYNFNHEKIFRSSSEGGRDERPDAGADEKNGANLSSLRGE